MSLLIITAKKPNSSSIDLLALGVEPKEENLFWTEVVIRTEDISEFYALTPNKTIISFYDERPKLVIKDSIQTLYRKLNRLDYDEEDLNEEE